MIWENKKVAEKFGVLIFISYFCSPLMQVNKHGYSRTSESGAGKCQVPRIFINRFTFINLITICRLREAGKFKTNEIKMIEKTKKVYEAPTMKVYEIGRTQILAGSANGEIEKLSEETYDWDL